MSTSDDFSKRPDDFPWPTRISAEEIAKLLYEKEIDLDNQDSRSLETKPPRFGGTDTYLTREEAAAYLCVSPGMLRDDYKHIPFYKLGGKVLYTRKDLDGIVRPYSKSENVDGKTPG